MKLFLSYLEYISEVLSKEAGGESLLDLVIVLDAGVEVRYLEAVDDGREALGLYQRRVVRQARHYSRLHEVTLAVYHLQIVEGQLINKVCGFMCFLIE